MSECFFAWKNTPVKVVPTVRRDDPIGLDLSHARTERFVQTMVEERDHKSSFP